MAICYPDCAPHLPRWLQVSSGTEDVLLRATVTAQGEIVWEARCWWQYVEPHLHDGPRDTTAAGTTTTAKGGGKRNKPLKAPQHNTLGWYQRNRHQAWEKLHQEMLETSQWPGLVYSTSLQSGVQAGEERAATPLKELNFSHTFFMAVVAWSVQSKQRNRQHRFQAARFLISFLNGVCCKLLEVGHAPDGMSLPTGISAPIPLRRGMMLDATILLTNPKMRSEWDELMHENGSFLRSRLAWTSIGETVAFLLMVPDAPRQLAHLWMMQVAWWMVQRFQSLTVLWRDLPRHIDQMHVKSTSGRKRRLDSDYKADMMMNLDGSLVKSRIAGSAKTTARRTEMEEQAGGSLFASGELLLRSASASGPRRRGLCTRPPAPASIGPWRCACRVGNCSCGRFCH
jgi:hypothetical protein